MLFDSSQWLLRSLWWGTQSGVGGTRDVLVLRDL